MKVSIFAPLFTLAFGSCLSSVNLSASPLSFTRYDEATNQELMEWGQNKPEQASSNPIELNKQLITAIEARSITEVKSLLQRGADPNALGREYHSKSSLFAENFAATALMIATYKGNVEIVKMLVKGGADIDAKGTFLLDSASGYDYEMLRILVSKGTALHIAASQKNLTTLRTLLALGAKQDIKDEQGQIAYTIAKSLKFSRGVKLLSFEK